MCRDISFRHSYVVSKFAKGLAWVCVILLNFFFVYFSMLRGLQRGWDWQRLYCVACVIQMIVEVLFYETSECAIVNYFIPDLARTEVQGVTYAIHQAIQSMFSSMSDTKVPILDAPRYLFVSTRLAEKFPNLLESVIVRSYHSYSPGELSRKWRISHGSASIDFDSSSIRFGSRARRVTFTGLLVGLLQYLGSASISVQRFFIHALQPAMMAGLVFFIGLILSDPWYLLLFVPLLVYEVYRIWEQYSADHEKDEDDDGGRDNAITPLPEMAPSAQQPISVTSPVPLEAQPPSLSDQAPLSAPSVDGSFISSEDENLSSVDLGDPSQDNPSLDDEYFHHESSSLDQYSLPRASHDRRYSLSSEDIDLHLEEQFDLASIIARDD